MYNIKWGKQIKFDRIHFYVNCRKIISEMGTTRKLGSNKDFYVYLNLSVNQFYELQHTLRKLPTMIYTVLACIEGK